jgi:hypothetical protein
VPNGPGYEQAWSLTQGDPAVVIAVVADGVAPDPDLNLVPSDANTSGRARPPR